jgi:hypothetical protein
VVWFGKNNPGMILSVTDKRECSVKSRNTRHLWWLFVLLMSVCIIYMDTYYKHKYKHVCSTFRRDVLALEIPLHFW